jgi:hypothetical protein
LRVYTPLVPPPRTAPQGTRFAPCLRITPRRLATTGRTGLPVDEPEQDVLGADEVVVQEASLFLGQHKHSTGSVGKALKKY